MSTNEKPFHFHSPLGAALSMLVWYAFKAVNYFIPQRALPLSSVEITQLTVNLPRLGREFDGYRIVQISDFHMGTWMNTERLTYILQLVNQQMPDLTVITGDFVSYDVDGPLQKMSAPLRALRARDGVLAVLGNHDYYWNAPGKVRDALRACGIHELNNDLVTLHRGDATLTLAGVDDCYHGAPRLDQILPRLPQQGAAILLAHEPDFADQAAQTGCFDLQLSGHSHGGQIILPKIGRLYLPRHARKYPSGMYSINGMTLYTNRGLGTSHLRLRVNCPPEITVFTLCSVN